MSLLQILIAASIRESHVDHIYLILTENAVRMVLCAMINDSGRIDNLALSGMIVRFSLSGMIVRFYLSSIIVSLILLRL